MKTPTFATSALARLAVWLALPLAWLGGRLDAAIPEFETRALWVTPRAFATADAADELIARCQRARLNLILPNVMVYQTVAFQSSRFAGKVLAAKQFDPLAYLIRRCRAADIRIEPWCCVYYEGARQDRTEPLHPQWTVRSFAGRPFSQNFLSPAHPEVNPYLLAVIKDLLAYDIDGIHLDYIRYPGGAFDYSDAARRAFQAAKGFDPQDFLDHPERIVPAAEEKFPVRVLQPNSHAERVWETTAIERTLDQARLGYAFVSESPENLDRLRTPGLLIVCSYSEIPADMIAALERYVARGGNLLWAEPPGRDLAESAALRELLGLTATRGLGARRVALQPPADPALARALPATPFRVDYTSALVPGGGSSAARYDDGQIAAVLNRHGRGRVLTLGFHLMKSTSPVVATISREIVHWFKTEAGAGLDDPLAPKRAEWFTWRGDRVTELVRDLSAAAKAKNPKLVISSSGGPSPFEFFSCYRDAGRWLAEGINDELFPMNYTTDPVALGEMLTLQTASAPANCRSRIFPGLQLYHKRVVDGKTVTESLDAGIVIRQLEVVREHGYQGFCLFASDYLSDNLINALGQTGR